MNKSVKEKVLTSLGILFLVWGVLAIVVGFNIGGFEQILWFSYIGLILMGIGIFFRKPSLVASQLAILGIPSIVWSIDFFYHLVTGMPFLGITNYIFEREAIFLSDLISYQHLINVPVSLFALYLMKIRRFDFWKISVLQVTGLFFVNRMITDPQSNVGCVFRPCFAVKDWLMIFPYEILWFVTFFMIIGVTSLILWKIPYFKNK